MPWLGLAVVMLLSVLAGFLLGWWLHFRQQASAKSLYAHSYYRGMSYLLNDQIDNSVDKFIDSLKVNSETLEIHLALGNLMRRKGEAAKAIKIHQNLLDQQGLPIKQTHEAQLELGRDYVSAGLLDRAEIIFAELKGIESAYKQPALQHLVELYQDEKEWEKAIETIDELAKTHHEKKARDLAIVKAHYFCELAILDIERGDYSSAKKRLKEASRIDAYSVRVSLLLAELHLQDNPANSLVFLQKIPQQDDALLSLSFDMLKSAYEALDDASGYLNYLLQLLGQHSSNSLVIKIADEMELSKGTKAAADFVAGYLKEHPSIIVLNKLAAFHLKYSEGVAKENLSLLKQLVSKVICEKPSYHCVVCGFSGNRLHWLCPGCKEWSTIKPIRGIAGD